MEFDLFSEEAFNAYLAGFTDGEGYIGIDLPRSNFVRITLANCVPEVLQGMQRRLGYGHIKSQQQRPHWRRRYVLDITNARDAWDFLHRIRPYLHIKADVADRALQRVDVAYAQLEARRLRNEAILVALAAGETQTAVGRRFGIGQAAVSLIKLGQRGGQRTKKLLPRPD